MLNDEAAILKAREIKEEPALEAESLRRQTFSISIFSPDTRVYMFEKKRDT